MDIKLYIESYVLIQILILFFSFLIDSIIGDPHLKYHPVNLIGITLNKLKSKLRTGNSKIDNLLGIILLISVILLFCIPLLFVQIGFWWFWFIWDNSDTFYLDMINIIIYSFLMGFVLKWCFAIKNLGDSIMPIQKALERGDIEEAKHHLSFIVRRDTKNLDNSHIISAAIECVAESSTDSVISVIWFFLSGNLIGVLIYIYIYQNLIWLYLGIPFAYIFRIINTADSIVGYKDPYHINIGWFSARMDDFSNFIPTRLTVLFMLMAGILLNKNFKNAWKVLKIDKNSTESVNAGWTISTMAGLLGIQLEKIGHYKLGSSNHNLKEAYIQQSFNIIKLTVFLFVLVITGLFFLLIYFLFSFYS